MVSLKAPAKRSIEVALLNATGLEAIKGGNLLTVVADKVRLSHVDISKSVVEIADRMGHPKAALISV